MAAIVSENYERMVRRGQIERNAEQLRVLPIIDTLAKTLNEPKMPVQRLSWLVGAKPVVAPRGIYIHGAVGRGKTLLMDLFFDALTIPAKRRIHFHEFMSEVHDEIGKARQIEPGDPIPYVSRQIAQRTKVLCFDELHVTDIADAMILARLFAGLLESGVVMVATSNAHPQNLYRGGLNRELFLPAIEMIERNMTVVELAAEKDFRLEKLQGTELYFAPNGPEATAKLDAHWLRLTGRSGGDAISLEVKGRKLNVARSALGVARFAFGELCEAPLGSADFLAIAHAFHTLIVEDIPVIAPARRDVARRLINLVDTLYDQGVSLIVSAEAEPAALHPDGAMAELFQRTTSRLNEMRSDAYLAASAARRAG
jgi:cell division protein ZapE